MAVDISKAKKISNLVEKASCEAKTITGSSDIKALLQQLQDQFPEGFRTYDVNTFLKLKYGLRCKSREGRLYHVLADLGLLTREKEGNVYFYTIQEDYGTRFDQLDPFISVKKERESRLSNPDDLGNKVRMNYKAMDASQGISINEDLNRIGLDLLTGTRWYEDETGNMVQTKKVEDMIRFTNWESICYLVPHHEFAGGWAHCVIQYPIYDWDKRSQIAKERNSVRLVIQYFEGSGLPKKLESLIAKYDLQPMSSDEMRSQW